MVGPRDETRLARDDSSGKREGKDSIPSGAAQIMSDDFLRTLPKAELHLHLEGTVDPPTLAELSRRHPTPLPVLNNRYKDVSDSGRVLSVEDARALYDYKNFTG